MKKYSSIYKKDNQKYIRQRLASNLKLSGISESISNFHYSDMFLDEALKLSKMIRISQDVEDEKEEEKEVESEEYEISDDNVENVNSEPLKSIDQFLQEYDDPYLVDEDEHISDLKRSYLWSQEQNKSEFEKDYLEIYNLFLSEFSKGGRDISKCFFSLSDYLKANKRDINQYYDDEALIDIVKVILLTYYNLKSHKLNASNIKTVGLDRALRVELLQIADDIVNNTIIPETIDFMKKLIEQENKSRVLVDKSVEFLNNYYSELDEEKKNKLIKLWTVMIRQFKPSNYENIVKKFDVEDLLWCLDNFGIMGALSAYAWLKATNNKEFLLSNKIVKSFISDRSNEVNTKVNSNTMKNNFIFNDKNSSQFESTNEPVLNVCNYFGFKTFAIKPKNNERKLQTNKIAIDYYLKNPDLFFNVGMDSSLGTFDHLVNLNLLTNVIMIAGDDPQFVKDYIAIRKNMPVSDVKNRLKHNNESIIAKQWGSEEDSLIKEKLHEFQYVVMPKFQPQSIIIHQLLKCNFELASQFLDRIKYFYENETANNYRFDIKNIENLDKISIFEIDCNIVLKYLIKYLDFFLRVYVSGYTPESGFSKSNFTPENEDEVNEVSEVSEVTYRGDVVFDFKYLEFDFKSLYEILGDEIYNYNPKELNFISKFVSGDQKNINDPLGLMAGYNLQNIIREIQNNKKFFEFGNDIKPDEYLKQIEDLSNNLLTGPVACEIGSKKVIDFLNAALFSNNPDKITAGTYRDYMIRGYNTLALVPEGSYLLQNILLAGYKLDNREKLLQIGEEYKNNRASFFGKYINVLLLKGLSTENNISLIPERYKHLNDTELDLIFTSKGANSFNMVESFKKLIEDYQSNPNNSELEKNYQRLLVCKDAISKYKNYSQFSPGSLEYNQILCAVYRNFGLRGRNPWVILDFIRMFASPDTSYNQTPIEYSYDLSDFYDRKLAERALNLIQQKLSNYSKYEDSDGIYEELNFRSIVEKNGMLFGLDSFDKKFILYSFQLLDSLWRSFGSKMIENLKVIPDNESQILSIIDKLFENKEILPTSADLSLIRSLHEFRLVESRLENFDFNYSEYFDYALRIIQIFGDQNLSILNKVSLAINKTKYEDLKQKNDKQQVIHDLGVLLPADTEKNYKGLDKFILENFSLKNKANIMKIGEVWNDYITILDENNKVVGTEKVRDLYLKQRMNIDQLIRSLTLNSIASMMELFGDKVKNQEFLIQFGTNYLASNDNDDAIGEWDNAKKERFFIGCQDVYLAGLSVPMPEFAKYNKTINGVRMRFLPRNDTRGMFLGVMAGCCQHPKSYAASCALDGHLNEKAAFCVWEFDNELILESYVWSDENGNICFDSFETIGNLAFYKEKIKESIKYLILDFSNSVGDVMVTGGTRADDLFPGKNYGGRLKNPTKTNRMKIKDGIDVQRFLSEFVPYGETGLYTSDSRDQIIIKNLPDEEVDIEEEDED